MSAVNPEKNVPRKVEEGERRFSPLARWKVPDGVERIFADNASSESENTIMHAGEYLIAFMRSCTLHARFRKH